MNEHPVLTLVRAKLVDPSRPFTLLADFAALPGRGGEIASAIAASQVVRLSRLEPGCLAYDLYQDIESPDRFVAHECWRDLAALGDHLATPHFAAISAALAELVGTPPTLRVLTSVDGEPKSK